MCFQRMLLAFQGSHLCHAWPLTENMHQKMVMVFLMALRGDAQLMGKKKIQILARYCPCPVIVLSNLNSIEK